MKNENPRKNPLAFKNRWNLVSVYPGDLSILFELCMSTTWKNQKLNKASGLIYKMSLRERGSNISQVKMTRLRSEVNVSLSDVSGASMNNRSMGRVLDFWMIARHQGFCSQSLKKGSYIEKYRKKVTKLLRRNANSAATTSKVCVTRCSKEIIT